MKILYHHRTLADGAEGVHIEQIVRALRGLEHDVRVWSLIGQQTNRRSGRASALGRLKAALPKMLFELAEIGYGAPAGVRLYAAARRFGANLIYERYACANAAGVLAKRALGIPLILEVNAPLVLERQEFEGGLALPGALAGVERYVFRHADRCIVVSTPLADYLEGLGTARARIEIMPNGADATRFDPNRRADALRERLGITGGPVVGFTGVVRPWHGPELLVEAVARCGVSQAMILFIGDGPAVDDIRALARDFGIGERVVVTGRVAHDEIPDYLAACDVTVSPRATFYASPMKIPEYMAAGRAVVAPRMPNIEDLVDDGRTGLLFEPESVESLAEQLRRVLESEPLRRELAANGRAEVERRLSWERNAARVIEMASELRRGRGP